MLLPVDAQCIKISDLVTHLPTMLQWLLLFRIMKIILVTICASLCDLAPIQPSRLIAQHNFSFCVHCNNSVLSLHVSTAALGIQDPPIHTSDLRQHPSSKLSKCLFLTVHQIPTLDAFIDYQSPHFTLIDAVLWYSMWMFDTHLSDTSWRGKSLICYYSSWHHHSLTRDLVHT